MESYAYARTGYHRGLDALRRSGWKGHGPVPWEHEPNRGFLRALHALARAAQAIGEKEEYERCSQFFEGLLALDVWDEDGVSVAAVRAKSLALTDFFLRCVAAYVPDGRVESVTPAAHAERGSQVALRCDDAGEVMKRLVERGVVGDYRAPDVLRFGFTPLYVGFADVERAARVLARTLAG
ncbi:Kynureninase [Streptomyces tendae]